MYGSGFFNTTGVRMSSKIKLKRGQKLCKSCGAICASRSSFCKTCNKPFVSKNTPIKNEIKDWKSLEIGVRFKVVQGTGSYYLCKRDTEEGKRGEKIYMGARGVYTVKEITKDGIMACGQNRKNSGIHFIYMGKECYCEATGITRKPHRLVRMGNKRKRKKV